MRSKQTPCRCDGAADGMSDKQAPPLPTTAVRTLVTHMADSPRRLPLASFHVGIPTYGSAPTITPGTNIDGDAPPVGGESLPRQMGAAMPASERHVQVLGSKPKCRPRSPGRPVLRGLTSPLMRFVPSWPVFFFTLRLPQVKDGTGCGTARFDRGWRTSCPKGPSSAESAHAKSNKAEVHHNSSRSLTLHRPTPFSACSFRSPSTKSPGSSAPTCTR